MTAKPKKPLIHTLKLIASLIVIALSVVIFSYALISNYSLITEVLDSPKPRTIDYSASYSFNGNIPYEIENGILVPKPDLTIYLTLTCQNGSLLADDCITVTGKAILKTDIAKQVTSIDLAYTNSYNALNKYKVGQLSLTNRTGDELTGSSAITWLNDGDYSLFGYIMRNYDSSTNQEVAFDNSVVHVFPRETLNQIMTNKVTVLLTVALFFFGLFGALDIGLRLWPSSQPTQNLQNQQQKPEESNTQTATQDIKPKPQPANHTKSKPKQSNR